MSTPTAAMIVIGDEILSGRTQDKNMHHLAGELTAKGVPLVEARVISDDAETIIATVRELSGRYTHVFTSGGIGPTHDDITADAVAAAFERPIDVREDARALLAAHYAATGKELNDARLRMARIPDGASLIENPVSTAPGFTIENVHVMAGVPSVFRAMVASVLATINGGAPILSESLQVIRPESEIAGPLGDLAARYPDLSFGSYPFIRDGVFGANVVVRGTEPGLLSEAVTALRQAFPEAA
ncbi:MULTISPECIES: competence/damage-inducible protein A [unclassified Dinoroseobacter]|uniref:competence/damage-inducible protein A n=1 Tax=unclassified Dinoroseobacter TaxID=2620028 RepID=UPI003C7ADCB8